jgi:hypothetical protein
MRPTPRERLLIALEEIRHDGSGAQEVFDWFGERTPERTEAWLSNCEATLRSLEEDTELPIELRGDWPSALPAAVAFARQGDAHPLTAPFLERTETETTLGRGSSHVTVFRGPLRLEGTVRINGMVVVVGALHIDGYLNHFTDPGDCLMVLGNETVTALRVGWSHFVMGALDAQVTFWSYSSINDGLMHVTGARTIALKLADNAGGDAPQALDPVRAWLDPAPEGVLSGERVCRLVASGTRVVGGPHTFET